MPLAASLLNSQRNGGGIFLIFVADPRTMRIRSSAFPEVLQSCGAADPTLIGTGPLQPAANWC